MSENRAVAADGIHVGMTDDEYFSHPAISQSMMKTLLQEGGAAKLREEMERPRIPTDALAFGSLAHALVLHQPTSMWRVVDAKDRRQKAWRDTVAECAGTSDLPVLQRDWDTAAAMAECVLDHPIASELLGTVGDAEVGLVATDPRTGMQMRGKVDWLTSDWIVDYKTSADASPGHFSRRSAFDYGYHVQAAHYLRLTALLGVPRERFLFIVQDKSAPYDVQVCEMSDEALAIGSGEIDRALDLWVEIQATGEWPGYPRIITTIDPPTWKRRWSDDIAHDPTDTTYLDLLQEITHG